MSLEEHWEDGNHHHCANGITVLSWRKKVMCRDSISAFVLRSQGKSRMQSESANPAIRLIISPFYLQLWAVPTQNKCCYYFPMGPHVLVGSTCLIFMTNSPSSLTSHSTPPCVSPLDGIGGDGRCGTMLWAHPSFFIAMSCTLFIKFTIVPRGTNAA